MSPLLVCACSGYYLFEGPGSHPHRQIGSAPRHCVSLAAPCLAVSEDGAVVSLQDILNEHEGGLLVDFGLSGGDPEDVVECEDARRLMCCLGTGDVESACFVIDLDNIVLGVLGGIEGPASDHDLHVFRHGLIIIFIIDRTGCKSVIALGSAGDVVDEVVPVVFPLGAQPPLHVGEGADDLQGVLADFDQCLHELAGVGAELSHVVAHIVGVLFH